MSSMGLLAGTDPGLDLGGEGSIAWPQFAKDDFSAQSPSKVQLS